MNSNDRSSPSFLSMDRSAEVSAKNELIFCLKSLYFLFDVAGRRKLPPRFRRQKHVTAQMVVCVGYRDEKHDTSPKFAQIGVRSCFAAHDEFLKLKL